MRNFEYVNATRGEAVAELLGPNGAILAGGTDLLALMKDEVVTPARLVNIKGIAALRGVTFNAANGMRIGALTTIAELGDNATVLRNYPVLAEAAADAASPQIRNMATLGGNLGQRPRCWYFRNGMGLLPRTDDGKSLVAEGENRYHAILGNGGEAKFVSPSTIAPVLIAYGARVTIVGPKGKRELPLEKFFVTPTSPEMREHDLAPGEIVTDIFLPPASGVRAAHYEIRQREAFDWPLATASVALTMGGGNVKSARVVLGHVAPTPWLSTEAAQALVGQRLTPDTAARAAEAAVAKATPLSGNGYKVQLAKVALRRALMKAAGGER